MRLNRNTFITLAGLLGVMGILLFLLSNQATAPTVTDTLESTAMNAFGDAVLTDTTRLTVRDNALSIEAVISQNSDGTWLLADSPERLVQTEMDNIIAGLITARSTDRFTADDLSPYGLTNPLYAITLTTANGDYGLRVGDKNPASTRYYALIGEDNSTVHLINATNTLDRALSLTIAPPIVQITPTPAPSLETAGLLFSDYDATQIETLTLRDNITNSLLTLRRGEPALDESATWLIDPFSTNLVALPVDSVLADTAVQAIGFIATADIIRNADLEAIGITPIPAYEIVAERADGFVYPIKIGVLDASRTRYYVQIFDLPNVGIVNREDVDALLSLIANPPYALPAPESTPESTPASDG